MSRARAAAVPREFEEETRTLLLSRLRAAILLAIGAILVFVPLDPLRHPDQSGDVILMRFVAAGFLALLLLLASLRRSLVSALWITRAALVIVSGLLLGIARLSTGANDPIYLVQIMGLVFVIMSVGVFVPVDGPTAARLGLIAFVLHIIATIDFDFVANLPVLGATLSAVVVASIGASGAFRTRLGDFEGRRAREDFAAMLTHDVRNPLGIIDGYVEMMMETAGRSAEDLEILGRIRAADRTALSIAANFLDLARIGANELEIRPRPTDLATLLHKAIEDQRPRAELKRLRLTEDRGSDLPPVPAEPDLLSRALVNLIDNAIKFTPTGGQVRVGLHRSGDHEIEVRVEDSGEGIPPSLLTRIFDRYHRGSSHRQSTGLGLYIVQMIARAHGGRVVAENRADGPGARFRLWIPAG